MSVLLWDASALAKRYAPETGTEIVNMLLELTPKPTMATTSLSLLEAYAVIVRSHNAGILDDTTFAASAAALRSEVVSAGDFAVVDLDFGATLAAIRLVDRHNLNASDAAILTVFLRYSTLPSLSGERVAVVASDRRFVRAVTAEGPVAINPETASPADVAMI